MTPPPRKWSAKDTGSGTCKRGFCQFVYDPIKQIIEACMNDNKAKVFKMTDSLGITKLLKTEDKDLVGKALMKRIMQVRSGTHTYPPPPPPTQAQAQGHGPQYSHGA